MNAGEYRVHIAKLGLSQVKAGAWLGVTTRTSARYANPDGRGCNGPAEKLIKLTLALGLTPEQVDELIKIGAKT